MQLIGDPSLQIDREFPTKEQLQKMTKNSNEVIRLQEIVYKSIPYLNAIQLKFNNGIETPLFKMDHEPEGFAL